MKWFEQEPHNVVNAGRRYFAHLNKPLYLGRIAKILSHRTHQNASKANLETSHIIWTAYLRWRRSSWPTFRLYVQADPRISVTACARQKFGAAILRYGASNEQ